MSFWKFAGYNILRIIGTFCALAGLFGGLIAFGFHQMDYFILAIFVFAGGVLLTWYGYFKSQTTVISYGINNGRHHESYNFKAKGRMKRRNKIILSISILSVSLIIVFLVNSFLLPLPFISDLPIGSKTVTGTLYFQSTMSDWAEENYVISPDIPNGEQKDNSVWFGSLDVEFISTPLKQNFKLTELTFSFYHPLKTDNGSISVECYYVNPNEGVQLISKDCKVVTQKFSRFSSGTITFSPSIELLQDERLHFRIGRWGYSSNVWYWGNSNSSSYVTYKGVPQNEEISVFQNH